MVTFSILGWKGWEQFLSSPHFRTAEINYNQLNKFGDHCVNSIVVFIRHFSLLSHKSQNLKKKKTSEILRPCYWFCFLFVLMSTHKKRTIKQFYETITLYGQNFMKDSLCLKFIFIFFAQGPSWGTRGVGVLALTAWLTVCPDHWPSLF